MKDDDHIEEANSADSVSFGLILILGALVLIVLGAVGAFFMGSVRKIAVREALALSGGQSASHVPTGPGLLLVARRPDAIFEWSYQLKPALPGIDGAFRSYPAKNTTGGVIGAIDLAELPGALKLLDEDSLPLRMPPGYFLCIEYRAWENARINVGAELAGYHVKAAKAASSSESSDASQPAWIYTSQDVLADATEWSEVRFGAADFAKRADIEPSFDASRDFPIQQVRLSAWPFEKDVVGYDDAGRELLRRASIEVRAVWVGRPARP